MFDAEPGSGRGRSRIRWRAQTAVAANGRGERGGLRVIYYVRYRPNEFWMLALYAKTRQEVVPAHVLKRLREAFEND